MPCQITLFEKENCVYCTRVLKCLRSMVDKVYDDLLVSKSKDLLFQVINEDRKVEEEQENDAVAVQEQNGVILQKDKLFSFRIINIKSDASYAALCIRLTGTFTVPQVFFNKEYIGDANKFNCCIENPSVSTSDKENNHVGSNLCEEVLARLKHHALLSLKSIRAQLPPIIVGKAELSSAVDKAIETERVNFNFPPLPNAKMVKVTNELAFCSQPTEKQLRCLKSFGFNFVISLTPLSSPVFSPVEEQILNETGVKFKSLPLLVFAQPNLMALVQNLEDIFNDKKNHPILVHDAVGKNSEVIVLLFVSYLMCKKEVKSKKTVSLKSPVDIKLFKTWAKDLGFPLEKENDNSIIDGALSGLWEKIVQDHEINLKEEMEQKQDS